MLFPFGINKEIKKDDLFINLFLGVGLSLVIVPFVGLALNFTPWGIRLLPISLILFFFTMTTLTIAIYREYSTNETS